MIAVALGLVAVGTLVELSTIGDIEEMKRTDTKDALYEAAKFRRMEQYDSILLQRKSTLSQFLLCFSQLRNALQLNSQSRGYKNAIKNEEKEDI
jgi:hypothetical protein